jgi:hypothetical protein
LALLREQINSKQSKAKKSKAKAMSSSKQQPETVLCGGCGDKPKKGVTFKTCSGCGLVAYCCTACQTKAWSGHKGPCKRHRKEKEQGKAKEAAKERGSRSGSGLGDMGSIMAALNMPSPQPQPQTQWYQGEHLCNACYYGHHEEVNQILGQGGIDVDWTQPGSGQQHLLHLRKGVTNACRT